jgi:hypothetical protein
MKLRSLIVLIFCMALPLFAVKIPSQVKKSVAFIFMKDSTNRLQPSGTGFFMLLNAQQNGDTANFGYLVTSKSSVRTMNGVYLIRSISGSTGRDGYSDTLIIPLTLNGVPRYFVHPDSMVDLAMVPAYPDAGRYDFLFTPVNMIASVDFLKKESISEGDEFFFTGLLSSHIGLFKNIPAVSFSRMIQLSEEKYPVGGSYSELYVIDSPFSSGSNGSPLYYYVPATKDSAVSAKFLLAGVVSGHFPRSQIERTGLTCIVPGYRLMEMMNLPTVAGEREKEFQRLQQGKKK